ncbi:inositol-trisphosphate 3-kinase-like protein isoform X1 [Brevipalpus obovatus]|uniref:inositol-trisphosphate 3-kinase-like protein isoform X1 n=1 Tax=Brevipalpus obovatus TaxID=246614 RepID=UPI003D9E6791
MEQLLDYFVVFGLDTRKQKPKQSDWIQLSGHADAFAFGRPGILCKRCSSDGNEAIAYELLMNDPLRPFVPQYSGTVPYGDERYIILENLLSHFKNPNIMDIKMGTRTFLEEEVSNDKPRHDLYEKMVKLDANAVNEAEKEIKAVTKSKYMIFREKMSSSSTLGFRIEAFKTDLQTKAKDLFLVKSRDQVKEVLNKFLPSKLEHIKKIIDRLHRLRASLQSSPFFANHEVVGSSLLIVYDECKVGVWMIDFAKTVPLPNGIDIDHSSPWIKGNHEDGYLFGLDNLIDILEELLIE